MIRLLTTLRQWFGRWWGWRPPGAPSDPYAWTPARLKPRPPGRSDAVAVAEPED
jgi:hypothetical protein